MSGFDRDDHVQQAFALVALLLVLASVAVFQPTNKHIVAGHLAFGALAAAWFFVIAKGMFMPLAWVGGCRVIYRLVRRQIGRWVIQ